MHTIMVVSAGLVLLVLFALIGKTTSMGLAKAMLWFVAVWLICAAVNMGLGVMRAGYTVAQEFPIFLLVFATPAVAAAALYWRLAR
jgi:hypothetical protein